MHQSTSIPFQSLLSYKTSAWSSGKHLQAKHLSFYLISVGPSIYNNRMSSSAALLLAITKYDVQNTATYT